MGSYPSTELVYGVNLGSDDDRDPPWFTEEMEDEYGGLSGAADERLRKADVKGVELTIYGDCNSSYTFSALYTQRIGATAYTPQPVNPSKLQAPDTDVELLQRAWDLIGNDGPMPEPSWFIVVSYG